MKYRLKDRDLQRKLDDISDGDFTIQLQQLDKDPLKPLTGICVSFGEKVKGLSEKFNGRLPKFVVRLAEDEIKEVHEYDPHRWNEWPDVEPPRYKTLRTEILTERINWDTLEPRGGQSRFSGSGVFDGKDWYFYGATTRQEGETVRFRPWVGPDEENEE